MKKKNKLSYAKWGYIFSIPFMTAFLLFTLYPILYTFIIGFTNLQGMIPPELKILDDPFQNFKEILSDDLFKKSITNTCIMWGINFVPQLLLALFLAAIFSNERLKLKGKGFFKVIFYMPNIITAATIAILFNSLFAYPKGAVNDILIAAGILEAPHDFANNGWAARLIVAFIQFWMWYGYTMIVLISGILGISPELFEAADIDGANGFQKFIYVTLPNIKTIMLFTLVTSMIGGITMYDIPKMFLDGGPFDNTRTLAVYIQKKAFSGTYLYNQSAAASLIVFVAIAILSAIVFYLMRDKDEAILHKQIRAQEKAYAKKLKEQKRAQKEVG